MLFRCSIPLFNANFQLAPPLPPDNICTDHDRQLKVKYEAWLTEHELNLQKQLQYYETEVQKLRKVRKSLNSKQRGLRKSGNELTEVDAIELTKITHEQNIVQKHLENARKQNRQHTVIVQDYNAKHTKLPVQQLISPLNGGNITHPGTSPANIAPQSPLMSPSPSSNLMQSAIPSPISNPLLQSVRSPLHSPSPLMSHSPNGPNSINSILQSPNNQANASMSPYSNMQPSPQIGTPHSQNDESAFSPSAG